MTKRLLNVDPVTGLQTWHEYDYLTDTTTVSYAGDPTPILETNKAMQNDPEFSKKGIKDGFWLYASIPAEVQVKWLIEHKVDILNKEHGPRISRLLNDPEYQYLKTTTGRHQFK